MTTTLIVDLDAELKKFSKRDDSRKGAVIDVEAKSTAVHADDFADYVGLIFGVHPAASMFPLMAEQEFAELKADIEKHGQREPIVYWRGQLLDGRNRLRACRELKIQPSNRTLDENDDPVGFVLSANLHRRHLTTSQRAMVAAELKKLMKPEAKERQRQGGKAAGKGRPKQVQANLPEPKPKQIRDQAGELLKVSGRSVDKAERILDGGTPELIAEVKAGKVSIDKAASAILSPSGHFPLAMGAARGSSEQSIMRNARRELRFNALMKERKLEHDLMWDLNARWAEAKLEFDAVHTKAQKVLVNRKATPEELSELRQQVPKIMKLANSFLQGLRRIQTQEGGPLDD